MYYLCTYNLIVYSNYYRRKGRVHTLAFFYVLAVYYCISTVSRAGSQWWQRFLKTVLWPVRRLFTTQKTVYDLKLLLSFEKVGYVFQKSVMFYQSLAAFCCFFLPLIIYKPALDKICLIHDVKGLICKYAQLHKHKSLNFLIPPTSTISILDH